MDSSKSVASESPILFLHIPKAAGSTLSMMMDKVLPPGSVFQHDSTEGPDRGAVYKQPLESLAHYQVIRGHFTFGWVLKTWPDKIPFCMTILRDPVERVLSHYYYLRRMTKHLQHDKAMKGLEAMLDHKDLQLYNLQVRLLSGENPWSLPKGECPREWLEAAKRNLREKIDLVGVSDRFDAFLVQVENALGWPARVYRRANVTKARPKADEVGEEIIARIRSMNMLDAELYEEAKRLQQEALDALPDAMKRRVRSVERRQRMVRRIEQCPPLDALARRVAAVKGRLCGGRKD